MCFLHHYCEQEFERRTVCSLGGGAIIVKLVVVTTLQLKMMLEALRECFDIQGLLFVVALCD